MRGKKVAVIGGGAAGLCAARHCTASKVWGGVTVFEQTSQLGGTWVYTEETGVDRFGLPVHTSMYKNLRTNLPKEAMGFPDFPIVEKEESYLPGEDILKLLNDYADHFDIRKHIKFNHRVNYVAPVGDEQWEVQVKDLLTNITTTEVYDAIMVCNGHYHTPMYPDIEGVESFPGLKLHSHDYRKPETFTDKSVLVIGGGPSGMDIALDISKFSEKVILSHHVKEQIMTKFPSNITLKPDVIKINENKIIFDDGSTDNVNVILFSTGYLYNFPFLSDKCGIRVEDNCVQPVYKHFLHIYRPTMCFIGIPFYCCNFLLYDLQAKVFLKVMNNEIKLPTTEEMEADVHREMEWRRQEGLAKKQFHLMGKYQGAYYDELSKLGELPLIAPVYTKLHNESSRRFLEDLINFRKDIYRIKDRENFVQVK